MSDAVVFDAVTMGYGRQTVLDEFGLTVPAGEFFGLVGVNGAGKTSSIKALLDLTDIQSGRIEIFGVSSRETRSRERLAYLPERFMPPYYLRGSDFLNFSARLRRTEFTPDQIVSTCSALDLDPDALDKSVRIYSKGMAQKLGLIACLLSARDLYVLDEPMSGLDPKARLLVKRELQSLRSKGQTVFFSTHMLSDVEELCDRMGILHDGKLRFVGSPDECVAKFGGASLEDAYLNCISAPVSLGSGSV
ncbi:MAG TPA: ABC transporter ATP-binding protein [Gammaproteobacteria bacterium]